MKGPRLIARLGEHAYLIGFRGALGGKRMLEIVDWLRRRRRIKPSRMWAGDANFSEYLASCNTERRYSGYEVPSAREVRFEPNTLVMMAPGVSVEIQVLPLLGRGRVIVAEAGK